MTVAPATLLVVDDDPTNLRLLRSMLDASGYEVRFATSGRMALASVHSDPPDLILLDVEMPGLSGYEVCERLQADPDTRDIPVVFLSAAQDTEAKVRSFECGGVDYVTKPFAIAEVAARIEHHLAFARQQRQIEGQAERLRELDALKSRSFAGVSHDLRTPLMIVSGLVADVRDGRCGPVAPAAREELDRALLHVDRLEALIGQLLDISRLEAGAARLQARRLDLVPLLDRVCRSFAPLAERVGVELVADLPDCPLVLTADAEALTKVVSNLVSNAFNHTPAGGTVTVSAEADGGEALLRVADTGSGIAPDVLPHVFERFYHADAARTRRGAGTGLGLSIAHDLVQMHGGEIRVASVEGEGSTFTVTLPEDGPGGVASEDGVSGDVAPDGASHVRVGVRAAEAERLAAAAPASAPVPDGDVTTVLVADDNAEVRRYIRSHLQPAYHVVEAADGAQALALARASLPDVVVSDVEMPAMDGVALCQAMKGDPALSFVPVVLLTVRGDPDDKLAGLRAGADDYLAKPFHMAELLARLDNLIAARRQLYERVGAPPASAVLAPHDPNPSADDLQFLRRLNEAIDARIGDPDFSVHDLAEAVAQDRTTLYRWTQRLLDRSPSEALRAVRMERAAALLAAGAGTVTEVAYAVGFRSVQHFHRAFRKTFETTPADYAGRHASSTL